MTRPAFDRVKVLWTGTGTGTMSLGAAITGFQPFPSAVNGMVVSYSIEHQSAVEAETGFGTYTSVGNTLTRTYRTYPTLGGAAVSFTAGDKHVRLAPISLDVVPNIAATDPTASDSISTGYRRGDFWINTATDGFWVCADDTAGAAVWYRLDLPMASGTAQTAPAPSGGISTVTVNATADLIIVDNPATTNCRLNNPTSGARNINVLNATSAAIAISNAAAATIVAALAPFNIAVLNWNGSAWTSKTAIAASGHSHTASNITVALSPVAYIADTTSAESHFEGIDAAIDGLTAAAVPAPTQVVSNASPFALATTSRMHLNVEVLSHTTNIDFEVPTTAPTGSKWYIRPKHTGCTVSVNTDAGSVNSINAGTARIVNGGVVVVEVDSNTGTAPAVLVRGDVIVAATSVNSTKTYNDDDAFRDWDLVSGAGTQTFGAVANFKPNFWCNIFNGSGGNITIDGLDADVTLPNNGVLTVRKHTNGAMWAFGSGTSGNTVVLDAA